MSSQSHTNIQTEINVIISVHWLAVSVIPEWTHQPSWPTAFHQSATVFSHFSTPPKVQLCSSDSPPLCRCGEWVRLTEDPASGCCCLEELDRSMATSSSTSSSSSISRSRSSSGSTSWASLRPHRSEVPQKGLQRVGSDSEGLKHFLDISNDFLCIPALRDGHSVQSASSSFVFAMIRQKQCGNKLNIHQFMCSLLS